MLFCPIRGAVAGAAAAALPAALPPRPPHPPAPTRRPNYIYIYIYICICIHIYTYIYIYIYIGWPRFTVRISGGVRKTFRKCKTAITQSHNKSIFRQASYKPEWPSISPSPLRQACQTIALGPMDLFSKNNKKKQLNRKHKKTQKNNSMLNNRFSKTKQKKTHGSMKDALVDG